MEKAEWTGKGWRIRWLDEHGRRRNMGGFTSQEEAEYYGQQKRLEVKGIKLGFRTGKPASMTFRSLCEKWMDERAQIKRSKVADELNIRVHLLPFFQDLKIHEVTSSHGQRYVTLKRQSLSLKTIRNHLTLLIAMLNYAQASGWLAKTPEIQKPKLGKTPYRYLKDREEIVRFLRSARNQGEMAYLLYKTALFTGARAGELAALTWNKVNFDTRLITIDRSFDGPTKSDEVRYVPILDELLEELIAWRLKCGTPFLFTNQRGNMLRESDRIFQEVLHTTLEAGGFPLVEINAQQKRYITFHDLRHTFASHWMMNGGDIFVLQKILGHSDTSVTQRYAHLAPHAFHKDRSRITLGPMETGKVLSLGGSNQPTVESSSDPLDAPSGQLDSPTHKLALLQK